VRRLEREGLLSVQIDPADCRQCRIVPTWEGKARQRALLEACARVDRRWAVEELGVDELRRLRAQLSRFQRPWP
jgi:DNA-binding MarR family transcriptional regulator